MYSGICHVINHTIKFSVKALCTVQYGDCSFFVSIWSYCLDVMLIYLIFKFEISRHLLDLYSEAHFLRWFAVFCRVVSALTRLFEEVGGRGGPNYRNNCSSYWLCSYVRVLRTYFVYLVQHTSYVTRVGNGYVFSIIFLRGACFLSIMRCSKSSITINVVLTTPTTLTAADPFSDESFLSSSYPFEISLSDSPLGTTN